MKEDMQSDTPSHDPVKQTGAVSRRRAVRRILKHIDPLESIPLAPFDAIGLTAASDITAFCHVPEAPCSLRDGYALRSADVAEAAGSNPVRLRVTQTVRAESLDECEVVTGEVARVLTGGLVPPGADAVLAEEDVELIDQDGETIVVRGPVRPGWFIRPLGGEIELGDTITPQGETITPQGAAVMIRTRVESVPVHPRPHARIISVGSELSDPADDCDEGRFPADNLVLASGLLEASGAVVEQTEVLPDRERQLVEVLSRDDLPSLVITTGGTGNSERDFAHSACRKAGFTLLFDGVDIRPGRHMFAAVKDGTLLCCLPGPPAAVFACFHAVILPAIRHLRGLGQPEVPLMARFREGLSAKPGSEWLVLCRLEWEGATLTATPYTNKVAPPMLAMARSLGLAVLQGGDGVLPGGETEILTTSFELSSK